MRRIFLWAAMAVAWIATAQGDPREQPGAAPAPAHKAGLESNTKTIVLPPETGTLKAGTGVELATANCLTCHSTEYVSTQPAMPRKFWEAAVKKMREKYGAPIAEDAVPALVEYLSATYGTGH